MYLVGGCMSPVGKATTLPPGFSSAPTPASRSEAELWIQTNHPVTHSSLAPLTKWPCAWGLCVRMNVRTLWLTCSVTERAKKQDSFKWVTHTKLKRITSPVINSHPSHPPSLLTSGCILCSRKGETITPLFTHHHGSRFIPELLVRATNGVNWIYIIHIIYRQISRASVTQSARADMNLHL